MRPQYRRFGFVDFDAMGSADAGDLDAADEIVVRQAGGDNVVASISQIPVGGGVPDPLLLDPGAVGAPAYSYTMDPDTGVFNTVANQLGFAANGVEIARAQGAVGANQFIVAPGVIQNAPATPSLAFGDGDTGFFESADDNLIVAIAGADQFFFASNVLGGLLGTSAAIRNIAATAIIPTVHPNRGDLNSGLGQNAVDQVSIIGGGVELLRAVEVVGANQIIIAPGVIQNAGATPSLAFGSGNMGFYQVSANILAVSIAGVGHFLWETDGTFLFRGASTRAATMRDVTPTAIIPTFTFQSDPDTGIGSPALDQLSLIAGNVDCINIAETAGARQIGFYVTAPISLQTGIAVTAAGIHAALVSLGLITA